MSGKDDATIVASTIELAHQHEAARGRRRRRDRRRAGTCFATARDAIFAQGYLVSPPIPPDKIVPQFVRQANQLLQDSDSTMRQIRALEELAATRR